MFLIFGCTDAILGCESILLIRFNKKFGSWVVSLFKNNKYSPLALFAPRLHPPAYPLFLSELTIIKSLYFDFIYGILLSGELLFTIIISYVILIMFFNDDMQSDNIFLLL